MKAVFNCLLLLKYCTVNLMESICIYRLGFLYLYVQLSVNLQHSRSFACLLCVSFFFKVLSNLWETVCTAIQPHFTISYVNTAHSNFLFPFLFLICSSATVLFNEISHTCTVLEIQFYIDMNYFNKASFCCTSKLL